MNKRLYKSSDKVISGVAGGVAEYFDIDKTIARIIWLVLLLFFDFGFIAYIACAIIMPSNPNGETESVNPEKREKMSEEKSRLLAISLICIGAVLMFKQYMPYNFMLSWKVAAPLVLVGAGVYLLKKDGGEDNE